MTDRQFHAAESRVAGCGDERPHSAHSWSGVAKLEVGTKYGEDWCCPGVSTAAPIREAQCAYRRVGAKIHHRVPGCGTTWAKFTVGVNRGDIEVLIEEPSDSARCKTCYSDESYRRHPL